MQLVAGGEPTGRRECHARYAGSKAIQGGGPVEVLTGIDRLDDQAHPLLLSELELVDRLQDALGEDGFGDLDHAVPLEAARLDNILPHQRLGGRVK
jgi:hypothetical protein